MIPACGIMAGEVPADRFVSHGEETTIPTLSALHLAFVAQVANPPLAQAGWYPYLSVFRLTFLKTLNLDEFLKNLRPSL